MSPLDTILEQAAAKLKSQFSLTPVKLKHPLPERPARMLGLVNIKGDVFTSKEFSRALLLHTTFAFFKGVRSVFFGPTIDLDQPIFSTEVILLGKRNLFLLDVQRGGGYDKHDDTELYDKLKSIRDKYPELLKEKAELKGEINKTLSPACVYVKIDPQLDGQAFQLFSEYLEVYFDLIKKTKPLSGQSLREAENNFNDFMNTVIDHDPGVKIYSRFFGKKGGVERALDMFFAR